MATITEPDAPRTSGAKLTQLAKPPTGIRDLSGEDRVLVGLQLRTSR